MTGFLKDQWRAFGASYVVEEALQKSRPRSAFPAYLGVTLLLLFTAYWDPVASHAGFRAPWLPIIVLLSGMIPTYLFWRSRGRGNGGATYTMLDTLAWITAASLAAALTSEPVCYAFAAILGLMIISVYAKDFSLTLPFALVVCLPPTAIVAGFGDMTTLLVIATFCLTGLWVSYHTGVQRELRKQNEGLRDALRASNELADDSMDIALTNTLLGIGNFLHELRNNQTSVGLGLEYLACTDERDSEWRRALEEAIEVHRQSRALIDATTRQLQSKSSPRITSFTLARILGEVSVNGVQVDLQVPAHLSSFRVKGDPDHLKLVLDNLLRNAARAGASCVTLSCEINPGGTVALVALTDDGPGIPPGLLPMLFQPFTKSETSQGAGLGLYLAKRRVQLFGGQIEAANTGTGGARFTISLPGRLDPERSQATDARSEMQRADSK